MRVLFTCLAAIGHFHPLVPVARALADAGHEVAFATHASLVPLIERAGFRQRPAGLDFSSPEVAPLMAEMSRLSPFDQKAFAARHIFAGALAPAMAADLLAVLEDEMIGMPGPEHAVRLLERLAVERRPLETVA
jgi:hypothetical protein